MTDAPSDPWQAFAFFVARSGEGFCRELIEKGKTATQARNSMIGCFLDFAAGEACRIARREGREPNPDKWNKAVTDAFDRAVKRTVNYDAAVATTATITEAGIRAQ